MSLSTSIVFIIFMSVIIWACLKFIFHGGINVNTSHTSVNIKFEELELLQASKLLDSINKDIKKELRKSKK